MERGDDAGDDEDAGDEDDGGSEGVVGIFGPLVVGDDELDGDDDGDNGDDGDDDESESSPPAASTAADELESSPSVDDDVSSNAKQKSSHLSRSSSPKTMLPPWIVQFRRAGGLVLETVKFDCSHSSPGSVHVQQSSTSFDPDEGSVDDIVGRVVVDTDAIVVVESSGGLWMKGGIVTLGGARVGLGG